MDEADRAPIVRIGTDDLTCNSRLRSAGGDDWTWAMEGGGGGTCAMELDAGTCAMVSGGQRRWPAGLPNPSFFSYYFCSLDQKGTKWRTCRKIRISLGVYFAYFSMGGQAIESCPFSPDPAHNMVLEQGIRIMDRITRYALLLYTI
jgi:hypothetical protein